MSSAPPPTNGSVLERLLRANEDHAKSTGALVELQRATNERLGSIQNNTSLQTQALTTVIERFERMGEERDRAVEQVKQHVSSEIKTAFYASEQWWRRAVWVAVGLISLSNLMGVGLVRLLDLLPK